MRAIRVFVLRLLVDPATPQVLQGSIQAVSEPETHPFADEQTLLDLLHRMVGRAAGACPAEERGAIEPPQTAQPEANDQ